MYYYESKNKKSIRHNLIEIKCSNYNNLYRVVPKTPDKDKNVI